MSIGGLALRPGFSIRRGLLARPRDAARDRADAELQHIFIISGPSGSGKSTFMREFVEDRLPANITSALQPRQNIGAARPAMIEPQRASLKFCARRATAPDSFCITA